MDGGKGGPFLAAKTGPGDQGDRILCDRPLHFSHHTLASLSVSMHAGGHYHLGDVEVAVAQYWCSQNRNFSTSVRIMLKLELSCISCKLLVLLSL